MGEESRTGKKMRRIKERRKKVKDKIIEWKQKKKGICIIMKRRKKRRDQRNRKIQTKIKGKIQASRWKLKEKNSEESNMKKGEINTLNATRHLSGVVLYTP